MSSSAGAYLIPVVFALIGLFLVVNYFRHRSKHQASESWTTVEGKISKSWIREDYSTDSDGDHTTHYYPEVEYVYSFMGQDYHGSNIVFGPKQGGGRSGAEKVTAKYPAGSPVTVYYDPNNPGDSVLERKLSKTSLVFGIVCLAVAVLSLFLQVL